ncbi:SUKH-3 domain-containing protein [Streptomyces sp. NPDC026673]|uniref:SUKH-3 domain-containing protein n=1 Tax=Streptomyces sp. NPDC026673 TaxID=3155724 RepID=UPI0033F6A8C6
MTHAATVRPWLEEHGWHPGRDVRDRVGEHVAFRLRDAERQGFPLTPSAAALGFLYSYGLLRLPYRAASEIALVVRPDVGYEGDAEDFAELGANLRRPVFPVGYETSELGIVLVDDLGRLFYQHCTGPYFLGHDAYEAFARRLSGSTLRDAEDFHA